MGRGVVTAGVVLWDLDLARGMVGSDLKVPQCVEDDGPIGDDVFGVGVKVFGARRGRS